MSSDPGFSTHGFRIFRLWPRDFLYQRLLSRGHKLPEIAVQQCVPNSFDRDQLDNPLVGLNDRIGVRYLKKPNGSGNLFRLHVGQVADLFSDQSQKTRVQVSGSMANDRRFLARNHLRSFSP